jgi:hypothetical protein
MKAAIMRSEENIINIEPWLSYQYGAKWRNVAKVMSSSVTMAK